MFLRENTQTLICVYAQEIECMIDSYQLCNVAFKKIEVEGRVMEDTKVHIKVNGKISELGKQIGGFVQDFELLEMVSDRF